MDTVTEKFERLVSRGICTDTADNRAMFAHAVSSVVIALLTTPAARERAELARIGREVDDFIADSESNDTVRARFAEIRAMVAAESNR